MARIDPIRLNSVKLEKIKIEQNSTLRVDPLKKEARERFLKKVNAHRPYCSSDFKKQYFIPDLSNI